MKKLLITLLVIGSTSVFPAYKLYTVDRIDVLENQNIKIVYRLPCKKLDFETITVASDDSGDMQLRVGVVFSCAPGPLKQFETLLDSSSTVYETIMVNFRNGAELVPMKVTKY